MRRFIHWDKEENNANRESTEYRKHQSMEKSSRQRGLVVFLPKFKITFMFRVEETLRVMGMVDAFNSQANFAGIDGSPGNLSIEPVIHKAFIDVNEEGTEAAAATAVIMTRRLSSTIPIFRADHPFVFLIQENQT